MSDQFEWDEAKRLANLDRHGFDFRDAALVFDGPRLVAMAKTVAGEERFVLVGRLRDRYVRVIYTLRGGAIRVISMHGARDDERRGHQALHGR